ncbi:MAG: Ycf34 family protein [Synechococcus sp.]
MCICVDCRWVDRCQAYHAVERQHGVAHLCEQPDFEPLSPRIHVSVMDLVDRGVGVEWDVRACQSFDADPGRWQRLRPGQQLPT